jgi:hypothetical protein
MPNNVVNEIIFRNVPKGLQETILKKVRGQGREIDFSTLLPYPINIWHGNTGSRHEAVFPGTGLDWNRANWGTKWNAYGLDEKERKPIVQTKDTLVLTFETAWSPPMGWIVAILNFFSLDFEHNWLDEGAERGHSDKFIAESEEPFGGPEWIENEANDEMQKHLHLLLWGVEEFKNEAGE